MKTINDLLLAVSNEKEKPKENPYHVQKVKDSWIHNIDISSRRTGKTTRLVDEAIQHLFTKGILRLSHTDLLLSDFADEHALKNTISQIYFIKKVIERINIEHSSTTQIIENRTLTTIVVKL